MNHIELFAGCGGLSLGLESTGFKLLLANELSPMASETFAYNFFNENLQDADSSKKKKTKLHKTKWLSSQFPATEISQRLREDPRKFPVLGEGHSDVGGAVGLEGNLIVGSIVQLNQWLSHDDAALDALKSGFGAGGVDLVSGGPPCQSFSMAGMREYDNARNTLPMEFANFVQKIQPKMALLENVSGILRPFNVKGQKVYAWFEVAKAFVAAGYVPLCLHVNAKFAGVAQNRPRFLMLLFREDIFSNLLPELSDMEQQLLMPSASFYQRVLKEPELEYSKDELKCFEVGTDRSLFQKSFLNPLVAYGTDRNTFSVRDAIHDLSLVGGARSPYLSEIDQHLSPHVAPHSMENHVLRQNSEHVQRRFRIYQIARKMPRPVQKELKAILSGASEELGQEAFLLLCKYRYVAIAGGHIKFGLRDKTNFINYLIAHRTKKQTQKALDPEAPAPAALSIPDDACHYDELRTLTVREMARIQSFPDNFAFRSKVTTGGQMRKFEVPQYTQVGNAVPPLLGRALGMVISELLSRLKSDGIKKRPKKKRASTESVEFA